MGGGVGLAGFDLPSNQIAPGETLDLTLYWQAEITPTRTLSAVVELVDAADKVVARTAGALGGAAYPTTAWRPAFAVRDWRSLALEAKAPEGEYMLRVQLVDGERTLGASDLAPITVDGRPRLMEQPLIERPLSATFDDSVRLVGVNGLPNVAVAPGTSLPLTLIWQPLRLGDAPLVRSVQLLDAGGALVAQEDSVPCETQCPATSWLPNEYLVDPANLALPPELAPGDYRLIVGWYSPDSGERLPAVDGDGAPLPDNMAPLPSIVVQ